MKRRPPLSLAAAAEQLGVHYMTAYRYVRTGRLPAVREGIEWRVDPADVDRLLLVPPAPAQRHSSRAAARERLEQQLIAGDAVGVWTIVERTLAAGATPAEIHLDLLIPSLRSIGERWSAGSVSVLDEHRASVVATGSSVGSALASRTTAVRAAPS